MVYRVKNRTFTKTLLKLFFGIFADMKHLFVSLLTTGLVVFSFILGNDILSYTCTLLVTLEEARSR
jgi:hypothetical protein